MGKASKRKQKASEDKGIKQSGFVEEGSSSFLKRYGFLITLFLITITAFLIYSNTFASQFHFDDTSSIVENYQIRDLTNLWPPSGIRYIGVLSFALNYYFSGLNVFGYHLVNIIIHIINSILVWWLVVLTFRTPVIERIKANPQLKYLIALTASLIFVSHPIQTQAITYIVQRFASLSTLFYLLSLALYIKARIIPLSPPLEKGGKEGFVRTAFYIFSLFSAILAMKTKEISFTLPFIIALYEFMFFTPHPSLPHKGGGAEGGGIASPLLSSLRGQSLKQSQYPILAKRFLYLSPFLVSLLIIPLSLIGTDKPVGDMIGELREAAQETEEIPRNIYLLTQFRVIVTYIRLLFLPINQNLDYDYPLSQSLFEPLTFLSFLFLISIFALAVYLFIQSRKMAKSPFPLLGEGRGLPSNVRIEGEGKGYSLLISFGILWFFITLSVESSIIPIRDVIFEHRLYLPSVGAIIAFSSGVLYGVSYTKERLNIKVSLLVATCILLLATAFPLGIATYQRNFVWKDEITFWEDVVRKSPNKARGYHNLGDAYEKKGRIDEAIGKYKKAIRLKPDFAEPHYNLGLIYGRKGLLDLATQELIMAIRLKPDFAEAHFNLGVAYNGLEQIDKAIEEYSETIRLKPNYAEARNNLGLIYGRKGLLDLATQELIMAIRLKPDFAEAHFNLGVAYKEKGLNDEAIREFKEVLRIRPDYAEARKNLESLSK